MIIVATIAYFVILNNNNYDREAETAFNKMGYSKCFKHNKKALLSSFKEYKNDLNYHYSLSRKAIVKKEFKQGLIEFCKE